MESKKPTSGRQFSKLDLKPPNNELCLLASSTGIRHMGAKMFNPNDGISIYNSHRKERVLHSSHGTPNNTDSILISGHNLHMKVRVHMC